MIHWLWLVIAFGAGTLFGFFLLAYLATSEEANKKQRRWWDD